MKPLADWIREWTPDWTDDQRYHWISTVHSWMVPACLFGFFFLPNPIFRFFVLVMQVVTITTEFAFRECIITLVEKEFSHREWDDIAMKTFKALGWNMTRSEKMTFNIGLNVGVLLAFVLVLLRESILWMVGVSGLVVTALPSVVWFSTILPSLRTAGHLPGQTLPSPILQAIAQTPLPSVA